MSNNNINNNIDFDNDIMDNVIDNDIEYQTDQEIHSLNECMCNFFLYLSLVFIVVLFMSYALYILLKNFIDMKTSEMKIITS